MSRILLSTLSALLICASGARAQDHTHDGHSHAPPTAAEPALDQTTITAPATPAGAQLKWVLEQLAAKEDVDTEKRFTDAFFEQVPPDRLRLVFGQLRTALGGITLLRIDETSPHALVAALRSDAGQTTWRIILNTEAQEPHRIDGLLFQPAPEEAIKALASWADADAAIRPLGEKTSLGVYRVSPDGELQTVHALNEQEPLAIGSAFKLFVLRALADEIDAGRLTWATPLEIRDEWKSLPSGVMQNLPRGTAKSVAEYARQMISISDNTATDHLLHSIGRDKVEAVLLERVQQHGRTLPFLSTREMFAVKLSADGTLLARYADADPDARRAMLARDGEVTNTEPQLSLAGQWRVPQRVDAVEWFVSTKDLCATMVDLQRVSRKDGQADVWRALSINPGLPDLRTTWASVGFKGGSEPGVLNVTWILERHADKGGGWAAVSLTVNDTTKPVDERTAIGIAHRVIEFLDASWTGTP